MRGSERNNWEVDSHWFHTAMCNALQAAVMRQVNLKFIYPEIKGSEAHMLFLQ